MPRRARLDASGTSHHVMVQGIQKLVYPVLCVGCRLVMQFHIIGVISAGVIYSSPRRRLSEPEAKPLQVDYLR